MQGEHLRTAFETHVVKHCVMHVALQKPKSSYVDVYAAEIARRALEDLAQMNLLAGGASSYSLGIEACIDKHSREVFHNLPKRRDIDLRLAGLATTIWHRLQAAIGDSADPKKFTTDQLDYLEQVIEQNLITVFPNNDEQTLQHIQATYELHKVQSRDMELLTLPSIRQAGKAFSTGGFLEEWEPTEKERELYEQMFGKRYESPREFFSCLIGLQKWRGGPREMGDVMVLGTNDGRKNLTIVRLPPDDSERKRKYGEKIKHSFRGAHRHPGGNTEWVNDKYDKLMEITMIAREDRFLPNEMLLYVCDRIIAEQKRDVAGVFLEHYEAIQRTLPTLDERPTTEMINMSSGGYFGGLGAGAFARKSNDYVFRQLKSGEIVGGRVTWNIRLATLGQLRHSLGTKTGEARYELFLRKEFPDGIPVDLE